MGTTGGMLPIFRSSQKENTALLFLSFMEGLRRSMIGKPADSQLLVPPYLKTPDCHHLSWHQAAAPGKAGKDDGDVSSAQVLKPGALARKQLLP